ncbi:unnamed protein product [Psylliodes chrysocephalus]|uniref:TTF-type domain-containing protein n=1 Tax=Psylliodes chrysocephalus TaxID=3402493 RepID=A0A9P0G469_9CUCU|nr:unnamed protein product [Psylliodes chrysocephala]
MDKFLIKKPKLDCAQSSNIIVTPDLTSSGNNDTNEREPISENIGERQLQKDDNWVLDFGTYLGKIINDVTKRKLLETPWSPDMSFKFPSSGPRNLKFQIKWLNEWSWLVYSPTLDSVFCKYCSLFSTVVGQQASKGGKLVKTPFKNWKDAREEFRNHEKHLYHKNCIERAANFLDIMMRKSENVILKIDKRSNN